MLGAACALAEDWPQFLGPTRNGVYTGNDLAAKWPAGGPAVVWKKEVGQGFSAPVVAEGRLILFHRRGDKEVVEALDAATGRPIWSFDYPTLPRRFRLRRRTPRRARNCRRTRLHVRRGRRAALPRFRHRKKDLERRHAIPVQSFKGILRRRLLASGGGRPRAHEHRRRGRGWPGCV